MLRDTYLVQRMRGPRSYNLSAFPGEVKPHHVFGGAQLGLSKEAWKIIDQFCTLDYMGAAEYEAWGGPSPVATGFSDMAKAAGEKALRTFAFVLGPHERELNSERQWHWQRAKKQGFPPAKFVIIYGLCHESLVEAAQERIRVLAKDPNKFYVKQGTLLSQNLDPISEYTLKDPVMGWFELSNGFLFFSDRKMWEGFCDLFEVEKCASPEIPPTVDYTKMGKKDLVATALRLGMFVNKTAANEIKKPDLVKRLMEAQEQAHAEYLTSGERADRSNTEELRSAAS